MNWLKLILTALIVIGGPMSAKALTPQEFFTRLNKDTMNLVAEFYAPDAHFQDPVVNVTGADAIRAHYAHQYEGLESIKWDFAPLTVQGERNVMPWTMTLKHPGLNGGEEFAVEGISVMDIRDGKVVFHRDYFDMGAFVYERVPLLRSLIHFIKGRMTDSPKKP